MILQVDWAEAAEGIVQPVPSYFPDDLFESLAQATTDAAVAIDAVNDFTRVQMREDSFMRRIIPPLEISDDELDRAVDTDRPVRIFGAEQEATDGPQTRDRLEDR